MSGDRFVHPGNQTPALVGAPEQTKVVVAGRVGRRCPRVPGPLDDCAPDDGPTLGELRFMHVAHHPVRPRGEPLEELAARRDYTARPNHDELRMESLLEERPVGAGLRVRDRLVELAQFRDQGSSNWLISWSRAGTPGSLWVRAARLPGAAGAPRPHPPSARSSARWVAGFSRMVLGDAPPSVMTAMGSLSRSG